MPPFLFLRHCAVLGAVLLLAGPAACRQPCRPSSPLYYDATADAAGSLRIAVAAVSADCVSVSSGDAVGVLMHPPGVSDARVLQLFAEASTSAKHLLFSSPLSRAGAGSDRAFYRTDTLPVPEDGALASAVGYYAANSGAWHVLRHSSEWGQGLHRSAHVLTHVYLSNPSVVGNHNPSFNLRIGEIIVTEDSGIYMDGDQFAININDNNGFTQSVRFKLINGYNKLFSTQPHIVGCNQVKCQGSVGTPTASGTLSFAVAPNRFGKTRVEVVAVDDGYEDPLCDGAPLDAMGNKCVPVPCDPALCTHSDPQYFWIEVLPVNDPPSFDHKGDVISKEDQPTCHARWATGISAGGWGEEFMQANGQELRFTLTTAQTWLFKTQPYLIYNQGETTASLCYEPAENKVGQASVSITLTDNGAPALSFPTQLITITIEEVNDPPTFVEVSKSVRVDEDSGLYEQLYVRSMMPGPQEEVDAGQKIDHFVIHFENQAQASLFEEQPEIDAQTKKLRFVPYPDANTYQQLVNLKVKAVDRVKAPHSPAESVAHDLIIEITPVNDPPSFGPPSGTNAIRVYEDDVLLDPIPWATRVCVGGLLPDHCVHSEGDVSGENQQVVFTLVHIRGDEGIFKAGALPAMDATGHVQFQIEANKAGEVEYEVRQKDTGPPPNEGPAHRMVVEVLAVNDPPTFELGYPAGVSVKEDSGGVDPVTGYNYTHAIDGFLINVAKGPLEPDENQQNLTCVVEVDKPDLFHPIRGQPRIDLTLAGTRGRLVFRTAEHAFGTAEGVVTCTDNGGTKHKGKDTLRSAPFAIVVESVSDAPTFDMAAVLTVTEDNGPADEQEFLLPEAARNVKAGVNEDADEAVVFEVATSNDAAFTVLPHISSSGTLAFTLQADWNGNVTLTVVARDVSKALLNQLDDGDNTTTLAPVVLGLASAPAQATLAVLPYNDPPVVLVNAATVTRDPVTGDPAALAVPVCLGVDGRPGAPGVEEPCRHTVPDVFSLVSVGPPDEVASGKQVLLQNAPLLGASVVFPQLSVGPFLLEVELTGGPPGFGGTDLTFVLRRRSVRDLATTTGNSNNPQPEDFVLPAPFVLNVTVRDGPPSLQGSRATSTLLRAALYVDAAALRGDGAAAAALVFLADAPPRADVASQRLVARLGFRDAFGDAAASFVAGANATARNADTDALYPLAIAELSDMVKLTATSGDVPTVADFTASAPLPPPGRYRVEAWATLHEAPAGAAPLYVAARELVVVTRGPVTFSLHGRRSSSGGGGGGAASLSLKESDLSPARLGSVYLDAAVANASAGAWDAGAPWGQTECWVAEAGRPRVDVPCAAAYLSAGAVRVRFGAGSVPGRAAEVAQGIDVVLGRGGGGGGGGGVIDIAHDADLLVQLPRNGLQNGVGYENLATIRVTAEAVLRLSKTVAPTADAAGVAYSAADVRGAAAAKLYLLLVPGSNAVAWTRDDAVLQGVVGVFQGFAGSGRAPSDTFAARRHLVLHSVRRLSDAALELSVGPDPGYHPPATELVLVNETTLAALGAAVGAVSDANNTLLPYSGVLGVANNNLTFSVAPVPPARVCTGGRTDADPAGYKAAATALAAVAVAASVLTGGVCGGVHSSVFPAVAASLVQLFNREASCNDALLGVADGSEWVLRVALVFSGDAGLGSSSLFNVLVAALLLAVHGAGAAAFAGRSKKGVQGTQEEEEEAAASARGVSRLYRFLFPSLTLSPALLLMYGAANTAFESVPSAVVTLPCLALGAGFVFVVVDGVRTRVGGDDDDDEDDEDEDDAHTRSGGTGGDADVDKKAPRAKPGLLRRLRAGAVPQDSVACLDVPRGGVAAVLQRCAWRGCARRGLGVVFQCASGAAGGGGRRTAARLFAAAVYSEAAALSVALPLLTGLGRRTDGGGVLLAACAAVLAHCAGHVLRPEASASAAYRVLLLVEDAVLCAGCAALFSYGVDAGGKHPKASTWESQVVVGVYVVAMLVHVAACGVLVAGRVMTKGVGGGGGGGSVDCAPARKTVSHELDCLEEAEEDFAPKEVYSPTGSPAHRGGSGGGFAGGGEAARNPIDNAFSASPSPPSRRGHPSRAVCPSCDAVIEDRFATRFCPDCGVDV